MVDDDDYDAAEWFCCMMGNVLCARDEANDDDEGRMLMYDKV